MKRWIATLTLLTLTITAAAMSARTGNSVAERALSANREQSDAAIAELRASGQPGVDAFVATSAALVNQSNPRDAARFRGVLDRICRQRDCYTSHLYWYTDLAEAEAAARAEGKPILSLRLLGNLDDELSCANSRFFRTTLYANSKVAHTLHDQFVLHWSSERPVPKATVDFGDGRKICSTVTGNSAHYLLDADGTPLDVLPGLYSPDAFLAQLARFRGFAQQYAKTSPNARNRMLREYHANQFQQVARQRDRELAWASAASPAAAPAAPVPPAPVASAPTTTPSTAGDPWTILQQAPAVRVDAINIASRATSKGVYEVTFLRDLGQTLDVVDDSRWKQVAANHVADVHFDAASIALMQEKAPSFQTRMLANLKRSVAEDTLRDELDFHLRIHQWFANSPNVVSFEALNQRVYAELFLTPASDPWLGLLQDQAFSAVAGGGVVTGSK
jgi:hypothetical protein